MHKQIHIKLYLDRLRIEASWPWKPLGIGVKQSSKNTAEEDFISFVIH
jgi:hypothetical protein